MKRLRVIGLSLLMASTAWSLGGPTLPPPPTAVQPIPGNAKVTLQWLGSSSAASYNIYWATTPGVTTASPNKMSVTPPAVNGTAVIPSLTNGTAYYFVVTAVNTVGESALSVEATATPSASIVPNPPTGVHALAGDSQASIYWDSSLTAESYNLYYRPTTPGVTKATGAEVAGVSSGIVVPGLTNGVCYYFVVTSMNGTNESSESSEVCVTPTLP